MGAPLLTFRDGLVYRQRALDSREEAADLYRQSTESTSEWHRRQPRQPRSRAVNGED